jgi:hypothetical protein
MIRGPAGKSVSSKIKIPKEADVIPTIVAPKAYWNTFRLRFLALQDGIATKAAVKRPPTIFTPSATITAIKIK